MKLISFISANVIAIAILLEVLHCSMSVHANNLMLCETFNFTKSSENERDEAVIASSFIYEKLSPSEEEKEKNGIKGEKGSNGNAGLKGVKGELGETNKILLFDKLNSKLN